MTLPSPTGWPAKCWGGRPTNCRPRPAGCWAWWTKWSQRAVSSRASTGPTTDSAAADIREFTGWGHTQLKVHLKRLEELEYLLVHRGGRGQSFVYELLYEPSPDAQSRFLARLIDVDQLRQDYDGTGRGEGQHEG